MVEAQLSTSGLAPLEIAKELGYDVYFVTNSPDRYAKIKTYSRVIEECVSRVLLGDTNTVEGIVAVAETLDGKPIASLYTHCDYNLPLVAAAARHFGLPGLSPHAAAIARDKLTTRTVCAQAGVPAPRHIYAATLEEAIAAGRSVGFPCVVKPMTESASTGVSKAHHDGDIADRFAALTASAVDARGQPRRPGVLVEEFALGYEVSVETVTYQGETIVLGVTEKVPPTAPYFEENGDTFPSGLPAAVTKELADTALAALAAIGFDFGAAHTEVKMTTDGPRLIEVNARIGGAEIGDLVELATGIPFREQIVRMHVGEAPNLEPTHHRAAAARYVYARRAGTVRQVFGEDVARRVAGVVDVDVRVHPGDVVAPPTSNHQMYGHVLVSADTPAEAAARADTAVRQIYLDLLES